MKYKPYPKYKPACRRGRDSVVNLSACDAQAGWLGEIPEEWEVNRLKFFLSKNESGVWGSEPISDEVSSLVLRSTDIRVDGKWRINNPAERKLSESDISKGELKNGDLLVTKSSGSADHIGKTALVDKKIENMNAFFSNFMQRLRLKNQKYSLYVYYLLNCRIGREQMNFLGQTTTGLLNLNEQILGNILVAIPPQNYLNDLLNFLDQKTAQIDQLIQKNKKLIKLLEEKRQAIITQAVTKGLNPDVEMRDSGVEWIGKVPKDWNVIKLKYIGKSIIGLTYSPVEMTDENGTLVLRASNIRNNKIHLEDSIYVEKEIPKKLITKAGDILICSRSGSKNLIGKNITIDNSSRGHTFGAFMTVFRSKYWKFLSYVFNSIVFQEQSESYLTTTINQLTLNNLKNMIIALPNLEEQNQIVKFLNRATQTVDLLMSNVLDQNKKLEEYRQALISNVVTGKIKV